MHMLANWTTKRSGANLTLRGYNEAGELEKHTVSEVAGPSDGRAVLPQHTIAWGLRGKPIVLVHDFAGILV